VVPSDHSQRRLEFPKKKSEDPIKMQASRVTVVIPCFNHGKFLAECIASLHAQTEANWHAIVLDDASTDDETARLCDAQAGPRVEIIHLDHNLGRALVRNFGIARAQTEAVLNLDADDVLAPTFLQQTLPLLEASPDIGVVYTDYQIFGNEQRLIRYESLDLATLYRRQIIPGCALLRRTAWVKTHGYHADFTIGNEDYDFVLRLVEAGFRGVHLAQPLYRYRVHAASWSLSEGDDDRIYRSRLLILQHHAQGFAAHGAAKAFERETYWQEARRLTRVGKRWAARQMWWRVLQLGFGEPKVWLWLIWP